MKELIHRFRIFLGEIRVAHSIFALPFAIAAAFMASDLPPYPLEDDGSPFLPLLGKIILACFFARTAAMAFNRFCDAEIDARNPRTANRALPAGRLSAAFMLGATVLSTLAFVATAWWINRLAFALSPVALLVLLGYSYSKRFTSFSHLILGAALGLSPLGAWIAVRAEIELLPVLLGVAVLLWTAGFDIIYACQDHEFDREEGLRSIPNRLGVARALIVSRLFHVLTVGLLLGIGLLSRYGAPYHAGVALVAALLIYEHSIVRPGDLSRVNVAFFTLNGLVSLFFMTSVILQVML